MTRAPLNRRRERQREQVESQAFGFSLDPTIARPRGERHPICTIATRPHHLGHRAEAIIQGGEPPMNVGAPLALAGRSPATSRTLERLLTWYLLFFRSFFGRQHEE